MGHKLHFKEISPSRSLGGTIERENLNRCEEGSIIAMMIREFQIEGGDGSDRGRDLERVQ